jgi:hypothetical protein
MSKFFGSLCSTTHCLKYALHTGQKSSYSFQIASAIRQAAE